MTPLLCPECAQPLTRKTIRRSTTEFNTEGKRWYQYAGPRIYCKHCGVRLRGPWGAFEKWMPSTTVVVFLGSSVGAYFGQLYGLLHSVILVAGSQVLLAFAYIVLAWRARKKGRYRYLKWDDVQP